MHIVPNLATAFQLAQPSCCSAVLLQILYFDFFFLMSGEIKKKTGRLGQGQGTMNVLSVVAQASRSFS